MHDVIKIIIRQIKINFRPILVWSVTPYSICFKVSRIHVKSAVNAVKAWNLVHMKLLFCRSKIELGAFQKFTPFVYMPTWLLQTQVFH